MMYVVQFITAERTFGYEVHLVSPAGSTEVTVSWWDGQHHSIVLKDWLLARLIRAGQIEETPILDRLTEFPDHPDLTDWVLRKNWVKVFTNFAPTMDEFMEEIHYGLV